MTLVVFLFPSDLNRLTAPEGHVNYCTNAGTDENFAPNGPPGGLFAQTPEYSGSVRFQDITDGLSQTATLSERVKGLRNRSNELDPRLLGDWDARRRRDRLGRRILNAPGLAPEPHKHNARPFRLRRPATPVH